MARKDDKRDERKAGPVPTTLTQVAAAVNINCGVGTVVTGRELVTDPPRLPTGVFSVDYATGGGFPIWGSTCLWGPESGGKTTLAINAMAMAELMCWKCFHLASDCRCSATPLLMRSAWVDVEGTFDRDWAAFIGADPDRYVLCLAEYAEQYSNIAQQVIRADDCGLVVVDSLAALSPSAEMESAAEDQFIGLQARVIGRMVRNLKQRLIRERRRGHPCTIIFINQMRIKIGQMFGDPETMSGGWGMKHEFSLLLRCVKKSLKKDGPDKKYVDEKRKKNMADRYSFAIRKSKVATLAGVGEYVRLTEDIPGLGLKKGQVDDFSTLLTYAKTYGIVHKDGSVWRFFNYKSPTLEQIKDAMIKNREVKMKTQSSVIEKAKAQLVKDDGVDETDAPEVVE